MIQSLIIPNPNLSIAEGAIQASGWLVKDPDSMANMYFRALAEHYGFSLDTPVKDLPKDVVDVILYGTGGKKIKVAYERQYGTGTYNTPFEGVITNLERRYKETSSDYMKEEYEQYMSNVPCPDCGGERLRKEALAVTVGGRSISQLTRLSVVQSDEFFKRLELSEKDEIIAAQILKEIHARLGFLRDVGLEYLTLSRAAGSLSGGEAQRIRLATQIGSSLVGVLYILDEPSIGLHQRDNERLLATLKNLRDLGNTLIVVEHDEDTMYAVDHIVDIGPGAGEHGGHVVAQGTVEEIVANTASETGNYLSGAQIYSRACQAKKAPGMADHQGKLCRRSG